MPFPTAYTSSQDPLSIDNQRRKELVFKEVTIPAELVRSVISEFVASIETMVVSTAETMPDRALAAAFQLSHVMGTTKHARHGHNIRTPPPTSARLATSLTESPHDLQEYIERSETKRETVLYLAYGSNLSNETFRGNRGIKPLSQVNVQVPSLRLTFDLPGIPYSEPCFANTGRRDPDDDPPAKIESRDVNNEKTPLLSEEASQRGYRKDRWHKGLIGVVYEVTPEDYAHIIATEGGGSSYHDILVDCHPLDALDPAAPVPTKPTLPAFKAHTLFAPEAPPGEDPPKDGGRFQRPDPGYAQASARYLKLISDGAAELGLPYEYQDYLHALRPYTITTAKQRIGQFVFLSLWLPFIALIFAMGRMFADDKGRLPKWMQDLSGAVFKAVWASYDGFFKPMFGDGERTVTDNGVDEITQPTIVGTRSRRDHTTESEKLSSAEQFV